MTQQFAQQNMSRAASGDARFAAHCFAFVLILVGTALAVSLFVFAALRLSVLPVLALVIGLLGLLVRIIDRAPRPGNR